VYHRGNHYHKVTPAEAAELRRQCDEGDRLCREIDARRARQGLPPYTNAHLKTNVSKFVVNPHLDKRPQQRVALEAAISDLNLSLEELQTVADAVNKELKDHARGDDDDSRQIIADLISDDDSPFLPDDEMALRHMSGATLREMRRKYLKRKAANHAPVANLAGRDFSFGAGVAGADFARRQAQIRANSDAYIKRNPVQRRDNAVTANRDDPAFQAMNGESLADALRRKREGK
jgi:hypothetical protein